MSLTTPPERFKRAEDYTPDEHARAMQAERRGETFRGIETPEYREYRADALRAAGLEDEAAASEPDDETALDAMTPAQHLDALRQR